MLACMITVNTGRSISGKSTCIRPFIRCWCQIKASNQSYLVLQDKKYACIRMMFIYELCILDNVTSKWLQNQIILSPCSSGRSRNYSSWHWFYRICNMSCGCSTMTADLLPLFCLPLVNSHLRFLSSDVIDNLSPKQYNKSRTKIFNKFLKVYFQASIFIGTLSLEHFQ